MAFHKHIRIGSFHKELERSAIKVQNQDGHGQKCLREINIGMFSGRSLLLEGLERKKRFAAKY